MLIRFEVPRTTRFISSNKSKQRRGNLSSRVIELCLFFVFGTRRSLMTSILYSNFEITFSITSAWANLTFFPFPCLCALLLFLSIKIVIRIRNDCLFIKIEISYMNSRINHKVVDDVNIPKLSIYVREFALIWVYSWSKYLILFSWN